MIVNEHSSAEKTWELLEKSTHGIWLFKTPLLLWAPVTHQIHQPSKCLSSQPCWIYHLWHMDKHQRMAAGPAGFKAAILWWCIRPRHLKINMTIMQQILANKGKEKLVEGLQEAPRRMFHIWTDHWREVRDFSAHESNVQCERKHDTTQPGPICPVWHQCHPRLGVEGWERTDITALQVLKRVLAQAGRWLL